MARSRERVAHILMVPHSTFPNRYARTFRGAFQQAADDALGWSSTHRGYS